MSISNFQKRLLGMQDNLLSFAIKLTANYDDAHDLLQDTTCKALANESKYVDDSNFRSWIFTIMRNIFINNYRRIVRAQTVVDKSDDLFQLNLPQVETSETPENYCAFSEVSEIVDGYKYQEIADAMNLPLGTVKSRIFFAKQKLQSQLDDYRR